MSTPRRFLLSTSALALGVALVGLAAAADKDHNKNGKDPAIGKSYRVPYRLTQTNHYLVRVRINGKGPFNFLVDTGAPALYIGTETAKKIGLEPNARDYWTKIDRLDLEGGATLRDVKGRIEDPFQLVGMNALGLPGASIDGILGFTILGRFRMEFDPTQDRMVWTLLDYQPQEPPAPARGEKMAAPAELQLMNAFGPMAKLMAAITGKQPEEQLHPRGFLGVDLGESHGMVRITRVLEGSPAAKAGLHAGDRLVEVNGKDITSLKSAHKAVAEIQPGKTIKLKLRRGPGNMELSVTAGEGL